MQIRQVVLIGLAALIFVSAVVFILVPNSRQLNIDTDKIPAPVPVSNSPKPTSTLRESWNKSQLKQALRQAEKKPAINEEQTSSGVSVLAIYDAIGSIEIDTEGLILDQHTKRLLERAVKALGPNMTDADLAEINAILLDSLPAPFGEQAGEILTNYYAYNLALTQELRRLEFVNRTDTTGAQTGTVNASTPIPLEDKVLLRRRYLGDELANKLYGNEEAFNRYLAESSNIRANNKLTPEQQQVQLDRLKSDLEAGYLHIDNTDNEQISALKEDIKALQNSGASEEFVEQIHDQSLTLIAAGQAIHNANDLTDFRQRVQQYQSERSYILNAGLVEADKLAQLRQLLQKYFSGQELAKAEYYRPPN